jgi:chemotaxis protein MotB
MRRIHRPLLMLLAAALGAVSAGCASCCEDDLCYETAWDLSRQNQTLAADNANTDRHTDALADQTESLRERNRALEDELANLRAGQGDMERRYQELLNNQWTPQPTPLPDATTSRLNELARRYPGSFEFDPATGISKFNTDILFETGKDEVRPDAQQMLHEFASILNDPEVYDYNVMIVGHTDDRRIARETTRAKHPTNWHLSAHRAISVEQFLNHSGITDQRRGVAGYGPNQPLVPNDSAQARQLNRRVEIFVLAPDSVVAGRTARNPAAPPPAPTGGAGVAQPYIDK